MDKARSTTFREGDILCERFRVLRFIARGGMGEVYEAEDLSLDVRVALKTVPSRLAEDAVALKRFKREITLSRKISHPNICRVHELFTNEDPETGEQQLFLTMELLRGESLGTLIRRKGRMECSEALPIIEQMVAGLEQAHREGIIHRDLKAENVFLTSNEDGSSRVVIMDFGLAKHFPRVQKETLSLSNGWVGTPAYVAPEQLRGKLATEASDIYSLGIIMFEMVTGRRPFDGGDPISTAIRRLTEDPSSPSSFVRGLDPRWEYVILRCLKKNPAERFQRVTEVLDALDPTRPMPRSVFRTRWSRWWPILLMFLVAGVGIFLAKRSKDMPNKVPARPSVAIMGLKNLNPDLAANWLGPALTAMIGTELESREALRLIPGEEVARARMELSLQAGHDLGVGDLEALRRFLGVEYVLGGSFLELSGQQSSMIRMDLRVRRTSDGETAAAVSIEGDASDLFSLIRSSGSKLLSKLGLESGSENSSNAGGLPLDEKAVGLYSQALEYLWSFDPLQARDLLREAVTRRPDFSLAHAALARAWMDLGYRGEATEEARIAWESSRELGRRDRLAVEALYRECSGQWNEAIRLYRALWTFYPDNILYAFDLAGAQLQSGDPTAALATVDEIRSGSLSCPEDRLDLLEARVRKVMADIEKQRKLAARAAGLAWKRGDQLIYGRARLTEASALWALGRSENARKALQEAGEVFSKFGDQKGRMETLIALGIFARDEEKLQLESEYYHEAIALAEKVGDIQTQAHVAKLMGNLLLRKGDLNGAEAILRTATNLAEESGDRRLRAVIAGRLALVQRKRGHLEDARETYQESYTELLKLGDSEGAATAAGSLAIVLRREGRPAEAAELLKQALHLKRQGGERRSISANLINLANISFDLGRLKEAREYFAQALDLSREFKRLHHEAYALFGLAEISREEDRLKEARNLHVQALELREKSEKKSDISASLMALALIDLDLDDISSAERESSRAMTLLDDDTTLKTWALVVSARVSMAGGHLVEAADFLKTARRSSSAEGDQTLEIFLLKSRAELEERENHTEKAKELLSRCLGLAVSSRQMSAQIEALLALGRLEKNAGEADGSRSHLEKAEKLAADHGYLRLLGKIHACLEGR